MVSGILVQVLLLQFHPKIHVGCHSSVNGRGKDVWCNDVSSISQASTQVRCIDIVIGTYELDASIQQLLVNDMDLKMDVSIHH